MDESKEVKVEGVDDHIVGIWGGERVEFYMPIDNGQKLKRIVNCLILDNGFVMYPGCGGCDDDKVCTRVIGALFNKRSL